MSEYIFSVRVESIDASNAIRDVVVSLDGVAMDTEVVDDDDSGSLFEVQVEDAARDEFLEAVADVENADIVNR